MRNILEDIISKAKDKRFNLWCQQREYEDWQKPYLILSNQIKGIDEVIRIIEGELKNDSVLSAIIERQRKREKSIDAVLTLRTSMSNLKTLSDSLKGG